MSVGGIIILIVVILLILFVVVNPLGALAILVAIWSWLYDSFWIIVNGLRSLLPA